MPNHQPHRANRLISTTVSDQTTQFNYNGDGARLRQIIQIGKAMPTYITYTQDLAASLPVVLQSKTDSATTQYLYSLGTRPIAQYTSAWEYLLPDALGSVRQIADASGNVTLAESYEPYGSVLTSTGTASSIFGYAGEQFDTTGLIYLRARYMQPTLGIFLSRDPWDGDELRPGSMNGWNYGSGNPVKYADPSGTKPEQCAAEWHWYGLFQSLYCEDIERGNNVRAWDFFNMMALYSRLSLGWTIGSDLLEHYLQRKGGLVQVDSQWYLRAGEVQEQRDKRLQLFIDKFLEPAAKACQNWVSAKVDPGGKEYLAEPNSIPEVRVGIGRSFIAGFYEAWLPNSSIEGAQIRATYLVADKYDFKAIRNLKASKIQEIAGDTHGIGDIQFTWATRLEKAGLAAPFYMAVVWAESYAISGKQLFRGSVWNNGWPVWGEQPKPQMPSYIQAPNTSPSESYTICYDRYCVTR